jgi:hypothetical protein
MDCKHHFRRNLLELLTRVVVAFENFVTSRSDMDGKLNLILQGVDKIMADLTTLTNEVEQTEGAVASVLALVTGLADEIRRLQADPAALQALADRLDAQQAAIAAAITANPLPTEPPVEPVP